MFHTGRIAQRSLSNGAGPVVLAQHAVPVRTYPHRRHASTQVQPHYTVLWHRTTSTHAWLRCLRKKPSSLGYIQCLELPSVYTECSSAPYSTIDILSFFHFRCLSRVGGAFLESSLLESLILEIILVQYRTGSGSKTLGLTKCFTASSVGLLCDHRPSLLEASLAQNQVAELLLLGPTPSRSNTKEAAFDAP